MTEEVMVTECYFEYCGGDPAFHEFPIDWRFGGANEAHPGADPRWKPTTYTYFDENLQILHVTQTPLCDGEAVDEFAKVRGFGPSYKPKYLQAERPGRIVEGLPYVYNWRDATTTRQPTPEGDGNGSSS